jgi:hypothetical protein
MARPEFPNCIMTPGIIHAIRSEQDLYDRDPEEYEEQKRQQEEEDYREQNILKDDNPSCYFNDNNLPF